MYRCIYSAKLVFGRCRTFLVISKQRRSERIVHSEQASAPSQKYRSFRPSVRDRTVRIVLPVSNLSYRPSVRHHIVRIVSPVRPSVRRRSSVKKRLCISIPRVYLYPSARPILGQLCYSLLWSRLPVQLIYKLSSRRLLLPRLSFQFTHSLGRPLFRSVLLPRLHGRSN